MRLILTDRCTASPEVKPAPLTVEGDGLVIDNDTITLDHHSLHRVEPHGMGDVHWQYRDSDHRFTHIEVAP